MNTTTRTRPAVSQRKKPSSSSSPATGTVDEPADSTGDAAASPTASDSTQPDTPICRCIQSEMARYFDMLDGQAPHDLYRMVMYQAEQALLAYVMEQSRHNQSKAAAWLGISRGTLRGKLADVPAGKQKPGARRS